MENTCIKVNSVKHGGKIIEYYYKKYNIDTTYAIDFEVGDYIGVFYGNHEILQVSEFPYESNVIELPTDNVLTFPRKMRVWDGSPEMFCIRTVLHDLGEGIMPRYIALTVEETNCVKKRVQFWLNAEEIESLPSIELTIDDIAKKYGVKPEQIKLIK